MKHPPSLFPTTALVRSPRSPHPPAHRPQDHAAAGLGAGVVAVLCMHPLDLLKVKLQVSTAKPQGGIGKQIWHTLRGIQAEQGWRGLYRGVGPNIAGNASSWGLYFLLSVHDRPRNVSRCSSSVLPATTCSRNAPRARTRPSACPPAPTSSVPLKQVRILSCWPPTCPDVPDRCCDCYHDQPNMGRQSTHVHHACRRPQVLQGALACVLPVWLPHVLSAISVTDGFSSIYSTEGIRGLWKGTSLALVGVSSGAVQFMSYEEMKRWGFEQKRRQFARAGKTMTPEDDKLVRRRVLMHAP
jgi:solute carrier family 25 folate transporter 32